MLSARTTAFCGKLEPGDDTATTWRTLTRWPTETSSTSPANPGRTPTALPSATPSSVSAGTTSTPVARCGATASWILALGQLVAAALVPVFVAAGASAWLTAASGAVAAVLTGAQQVLQVGPDSLRLGAARVAVDRELRLYRAQAGPYADPADGQQLLAERVEAVVASETTAWSTRHPKNDEVSGSTGG